MTDNTMILALEEELAKCETEANKIRFKQETYDSLRELSKKIGMAKRKATKEV